jgi:hypothetical protein
MPTVPAAPTLSLGDQFSAEGAAVGAIPVVCDDPGWLGTYGTVVPSPENADLYHVVTVSVPISNYVKWPMDPPIPLEEVFRILREAAVAYRKSGVLVPSTRTAVLRSAKAAQELRELKTAIVELNYPHPDKKLSGEAIQVVEFSQELIAKFKKDLEE